MKLCKDCENKGKKRQCKFYSDMSNYAERCSDFEVKKPTNYERIHAMSIEELAVFLRETVFEEGNNIFDCDDYINTEHCKGIPCKECKAFLHYLKSKMEV